MEILYADNKEELRQYRKNYYMFLETEGMSKDEGREFIIARLKDKFPDNLKAIEKIYKIRTNLRFLNEVYLFTEEQFK